MPGHLHHGDDGGDAVVAAAGAAHHRVGAAGHAPLGAGGHPHHGAGHQAAAHDVGGQVGLEGVGDADAQAVLQAVVGEGLVHLRALQHKGQLLLAGGVRQLPELGDGHGLKLGVERVLAAGGVLLLKEHLVVGAGVDDVGVGVPDGADADAPGGDDLGVGVEPALPLGDGHAYLLVLHQTDGLLADDAVDLLQQLQPLLRVAQAGTQGGGVLQAHPLEAGDAHAHAVLVDAGVDLHLDGYHLSADGVVGVGGAEGHAHGLGAPQGGNHLLVQQGQHLFLVQLHRSSLLFRRPRGAAKSSAYFIMQPACQLHFLASKAKNPRKKAGIGLTWGGKSRRILLNRLNWLK